MHQSYRQEIEIGKENIAFQLWYTPSCHLQIFQQAKSSYVVTGSHLIWKHFAQVNPFIPNANLKYSLHPKRPNQIIFSLFIPHSNAWSCTISSHSSHPTMSYSFLTIFSSPRKQNFICKYIYIYICMYIFTYLGLPVILGLLV